jgi:cystathionine beta-synthase
VVGVGTGGTIAGISRKIKMTHPDTIIVGADPYGSILSIPASLNVDAPPNKVEGIGYDFIPKTCMRTCVDKWIKTDDIPSFTNARNLIRQEGLLCGGSAGSVLQAAFEFVKQMGW